MVSGFTEALGATFAVAAHLMSANPAVDFDKAQVDTKEAFCLAQNLWHEARGTSRRDRLAVAWTTLNRVRHDSYPDTVCDVVWQRSQFSWTNDGRSDRLEFKNNIDLEVWAEIVEVTLLTIVGLEEDLTQGSTHYHAHSVNPNWASHFEDTIETDGHAFYRMDRTLLVQDTPDNEPVEQNEQAAGDDLVETVLADMRAQSDALVEQRRQEEHLRRFVLVAAFLGGHR